MASPLEYHQVVNRPAQRPIQFAVPLFAIFLLPAVLFSPALAQGSAGSSGSSHAASPAPSNAPHYAGASTSVFHPVPHPPPTPHPPAPPRQSSNGSGQSAGTPFAYYYPYLYVSMFPYPVTPDGGDPNPPDDASAEDQGGPTVFDRRGSGPDSYIPPSPPPQDSQARDSGAQDSRVDDDAPLPSQPEPPQPPTTLVFKDGHQLQVDNYAIVGQTLYDLTPGHPRKIALADLDLAATEKQNDDRGITFQVPPMSQAN